MEQIKVLVVDPDDALQNFLAQMLTKRNYAVLHARTMQEGLAVATTKMPSIIISETRLPDGTALDLYQKLHINPTVSGIPCVILTAHSDPEEMQAHIQTGFAEYYIKSGMVMMGLVEAIPKIIVEAQKQHVVKQKGLLFAFVSAKGGIGTSSLCANIGMNIAQQISPATVAVMDMVLPIGSISDIVGYKEDFNLVNIAAMTPEAITPSYMQESLTIPPHWGFHLLPGCPNPKIANNLQIDRIPVIIDALREAYNYVLIDLGRSLSRISLPIIKEADLIALILSTDLSTTTHTKKLWGYFQEEGIEAKKIFPILNRAVGLEGLTKAEAEMLLGLDIKLTMPYLMGNFTLANNQNLPISLKFPTDTASMIFKEAAIDMSRYVTRIQSR